VEEKMNRPMSRTERWMFALTLLLVCAVTPPAAAQTTPAAPAVDATGTNVKEITSFECVEPRPEGEIRQDLDASKEEKSAAEARLAAARQSAVSAKGRVEIAKGARDVTKSQLDLAKKEKRDADVLRLESLKKRQDLEVKFYEKVADVQNAAVERLGAIKDLAEARQKTCELELLLLDRRAAFQGLPAGDPSAPAKEKEMRETERKTLDAMNDLAGKGKDLGGKEKDLAEKRTDLYEVVTEYRQLP
jgi:hypothetical protein